MMHSLAPGVPAPWFRAPTVGGNPRFAFDTAAGRPLLLLFHGSTIWSGSADAIALVRRHRALFDDIRAAFFGVCLDPADATEGRVAQELPGIRWFVDADAAVARSYAAVGGEGADMRYYPQWVVLDATLRVVSTHPLADGAAAFERLVALIDIPDAPPAAPVLVVPRVFEPDLCRQLVSLYETNGGEESGFMREEDGLTVLRVDPSHKRRADCPIEDAALLDTLRLRIRRALVPQIQRAFQFEVQRIERFIVACYDGASGGHFRPHRDNTTPGTAHRRFACTINLNADEYEGGDLRFPEFGPRSYRAPTGGAVIFSCSLLHEALPVTRGRRYAFLPFLYDDAAAKIREANLSKVSPELRGYRAGLTEPAA